MASNSYWDGRKGLPHSGGSLTDYELGKRDAGIDKRGSQSSPDSPAGCLFIILLAIFVIQGFTTHKTIYWILSALTIVAAIIVSSNPKLSKIANLIAGTLIIIFLIILLIAFFK